MAKKASSKSRTAAAVEKSSSQKSPTGPDIIQLILEDHRPLKRLIAILKDSDKSLAARRRAFEDFAPLLVKHAKPEEQILYTYLKDDKEMRSEGLEGDVEHGLADQLLEEAKRTQDKDQWSARVKVLAELVEHHIEEEEKEMLPEFKKNSEKDVRVQLGHQFIVAKNNVLSDGSERSPERKPSPRDELVAPH